MLSIQGLNKRFQRLLGIQNEMEENLNMFSLMHKGLEERVSENERRIASLEDENTQLKMRLEKLEKLMERHLKE